MEPISDSTAVSINGAPVPGSGVTVTDDFKPELDVTYMIDEHWGIEAIASITQHEVKATGSLAALGEVISTDVLPPTVLLQYHLQPGKKFNPYVGVGANFTYFFNSNSEGLINNPMGFTKVNMSSS